MKKPPNILDSIIDYLDVERQMGTAWVPTGKGGAARTPPATGGGEEAAASPPEDSVPPPPPPRQPERAAAVPSTVERSLPAIARALGTTDAEELRRRARALDEIDAAVRACRKCVLHEQRTKTVLQDGSPAARIAFVGEGPGADEDASGVPFVGRAGRLLTKIVEAMGLRREDVYICNTVKCRPPGNRTPARDEMETCWPYLEKQLEIVKPDLIVALGLPAAQMLVKGVASISRNRGRWMEYRRTPVMLTYHPAYLLRNPSAKRLVWEDMKLVHEALVKGKAEIEVPALSPAAAPAGTTLSLFGKK